MLVLSRKKHEAICIGSDIRIVVTAISGSRVCIGIEAPRDVAVYREEVAERVQEAEQTTAG
jgi:carbon storage regulator